VVMNWWSVLGWRICISDPRELMMLKRGTCYLVYMEEKDGVVQVVLEVIYCPANIQRLVA
jgi:hypothetical protein